MRAVHAGPATGLIAQVLLLAALAGTVGLSGAGWVVGVTCGVIANAALARGLSRYGSERLGPADWVTLARATLAVGVAALVADSFDQPAPVAMLVTLTVVALALDAVDGLGRATQRDGVGVGRALRRRGRRVPDPRPQRVRRPLGRRVGARDRRGTLRVPRSRVAAAVDARAAAAALLAQGRRCDSGDRADDRGCRRPAAGSDPGRPRRRACPACRVVRPRRLVAVEPPARHALERAAAEVAATPRTDACEHVSPRCSRSSPLCSCGSPSSLPNQPSRLTPGAFVRLPLEGLVVVALALVLPATARRLLAWVVGPAARSAGDREDPRHRLLRDLRPAVRPRRRLELRRDRHRDAARLDRPDGARTWPSPARRCSASPCSSSRPWRCFA